MKLNSNYYIREIVYFKRKKVTIKLLWLHIGYFVISLFNMVSAYNWKKICLIKNISKKCLSSWIRFNVQEGQQWYRFDQRHEYLPPLLSTGFNKIFPKQNFVTTTFMIGVP